MEIKNKQELLEYIASLEERINSLENPSKDGDGDGKVNEDEPKEDEVDEIEKFLED